MATLSTTVPDAVVTRVAAAFGSFDKDNNWVSATGPQVSKAIQRFIAGRLIDYESNTAKTNTANSVKAETDLWT